jgi:hypothetical protein
MGLLTAYLAYKYGKRRAEAEQEEMLEVCYDCGYPRHMHADDAIESCPV